MNDQKGGWESFWKRSPDVKTSWSKKRIIEAVNPCLKEGQIILDAGCGSGFFSAYFCDKGLDTVSVDYSEEALSITKETTSSRSKIFRTDLLDDNFCRTVPLKFDVIFSDGLFEHFADDQQDKILANFKKTLNENGTIITFVPNLYSPWTLIRPFMMPGIKETPFTKNKLKNLNARNGLRVIKSGGVNVLPYMASPEKLMGRDFGMLLYSISVNSVKG